jgi:hypothetical protein
MVLRLKDTIDFLSTDVNIDEFMMILSKNISSRLFTGTKIGDVAQTPQVTTYSHEPFYVKCTGAK